jgi:hypothetical protein
VSPLIQADDAGDLGRLQVLQEPQVTELPVHHHGPVAHDVLERLDGPHVTPVGYRLPTHRGWPAPDGGSPKAPRLPHGFGLPGLGAFHLGGASASSRNSFLKTGRGATRRKNRWIRLYAASAFPLRLTKGTGRPDRSPDLGRWSGNASVAEEGLQKPLHRDTLGYRGPPWDSLFTSHEVPCHLFVLTHVRT